MRSTFMGLETARRGMFTQQSALHTTGHNISNANTPGYTRQRINFEQTEPYPNASLNRPQIPGQVGTGVKAGSIQRVRESFLDVQYRGENNKLGYWETRAEAYNKLEEVLNEPSESGLSKTMDQFWQSLQDLAVNPTNPGARSVVRQRGIAVAETFNYLHNSLSSIQRDLKNEITVAEKEINSITYQISKINGQIAAVEPHGYLPNDLYDERDRLIDQLSSIANIKVDYTNSGGGSLKMAEGQAVIKMVSDSGKELGILVSGDRYNEVNVNFDGAGESVKTVSIGQSKFDFNDLKTTGKLKALIDSYGYEKDGKVAGVYPEMMTKLDDLAYTFATEFNKVHETGVSPNDILKGEKAGNPFFADAENETIERAGFAGRIALAQEIHNSLDNIATAQGEVKTDANGDKYVDATVGDSSNALELANVFNKPLEYAEDFTPNNMADDEMANFRNYYEGVIGGMAVLSQEAVRLTQNSGSLREAVDNRRKSVSSVSLDEEMTNMIQFQHAYNASARMITLQDEMLDKIINGMGTVGR
ncbi:MULTISPECIES: flagellar hook-associated protein FlgK [unclassified Mesobacillus]|uniref:flagellar hook-associated protein FlgK n=1 Tax=unclassified Mesobacillus TaxID=2675270 RepID=UPI002041C3AB|nr:MULTISPECIES: flagellar hook-associated protein FlgK [unclassified Mesobacillus]MCM3124133.1 flagellar hook-associated protein FlgK [Mesobacillus sp. MER 33]MCM3233982.1 flagellar hook-associated protein FlgK [Mesobacillus sp. MER 48]